MATTEIINAIYLTNQIEKESTLQLYSLCISTAVELSHMFLCSIQFHMYEEDQSRFGG